MKTVSIFAGHDANVVFSDTEKNTYHTIEIERLVKKRYFRLHANNTPEVIKDILIQCRDIAVKHWGFDRCDAINIVEDGDVNHDILSEIFGCKVYNRFDHHHCHAASTFYQSGFEEAIVISYDGGGNDGFFNVYSAGSDGIRLQMKFNCDFGGGYMLLASCLEEIAKDTRHQLALPGKMMGLCAYGKATESVAQEMSKLFFNKDYASLAYAFGLKNPNSPWPNILDNYNMNGQVAYDFAANAQLAYEWAFIRAFTDIMAWTGLKKNLCITGGGALNVLLNQKLKDNCKLNVFVAPNPNDCGLALGASFLHHPPKQPVDVTYLGLPILDLEKQNALLKNRNCQPLDLNYVCNLLKAGKIIGICRGDSEVGPRALGNRSIVCDPSYPDMKDILNAKVKFREWYRPFAPFCLKGKASQFFESRDFDNFEFMSYAPIVKAEYRQKLPAITHIDNSSRLQCVSEDSHTFFYTLLKTYEKYTDIPVLLNTSFNIRGNPILSSIEDALYVLDNTELDYVIINDILVSK